MRFFAPSHLGLSKAKTSSAASESEPAASGMLLYAASWLFSLMPNQGLKLTSLPRLDELMKDILLMGPAREMHCSAALCRGMDWRTVSLWPSTVNQVNKCLISLSGVCRSTCIDGLNIRLVIKYAPIGIDDCMP